MDPYPLTTLLALRRREEEAAEARWAATLATVRAAEARLDELAAAVQAARGRLDEAVAGGAGDPASADAAVFAGDVLTRARFLARRRDEWTRAAAARTAFRDGQLAEARTAEAEARGAHADKRRAREAVEKHQEQFLTEARRQAERRAEDTRDDVASANRHRRERES